MIKVIVAGSRGFRNYGILKGKLDLFLSQTAEPVEIVSGTAAGADLLGEQYARETGLTVKRFPADWSLGKRAGYLRNEQMALYATHCVCFWDGKSRGTKHMIDLAIKHGLKLRIVNYQGNG